MLMMLGGSVHGQGAHTADAADARCICGICEKQSS